MSRRIAFDADAVKAGSWIFDREIQAERATVGGAGGGPPQPRNLVADCGLEAIDLAAVTISALATLVTVQSPEHAMGGVDLAGRHKAGIFEIGLEIVPRGSCLAARAKEVRDHRNRH